MKHKYQAMLKKYLSVLILTVIGAVGGYLYYRFVGCASGACAITSNPVISTVYGGVLGGLIGAQFTPAKRCSCEADKCEEENHE